MIRRYKIQLWRLLDMVDEVTIIPNIGIGQIYEKVNI